MRVNVYAEEITGEVSVVEKNGHRGLRVWLASADSLHHTAEDDDRSAITFWGFDACEGLAKSIAWCVQKWCDDRRREREEQLRG